MSAFVFHPELFEERQRVLESLAEADYSWPGDFGSIDLLHDVYGLEVCGIREQEDCRRILNLLSQLYPGWPHSYMYYKDCGAEMGWKAVIHRDCENHSEPWNLTSGEDE
jgi:hypothetical protein